MPIFPPQSIFKRSIGAILFLGLSATVPVEARASLMTYSYSGTITSADASTGIAVGTPFSGTFAYDPSETASRQVTYSISASYDFGQVPGVVGGTPDSSGFTLSAGGTSILNVQGGVQLGVQDIQMANPSGSQLGTSTNIGIGEPTGTTSPTSVSLSFNNPSASIYNSLAPPSNLNLANFPSSTLYVYGYGNTGAWSNLPVLQGTIDSLALTSSSSPVTPPPTPSSPTPTPEPSTLTPLGLGALAWLWRSRRRRA